ncbi:glycosyltransferase [Azospirillum formosense]|uniref:glycosyltransferase n=1 Tax=Azospirillum formosense TaxID=861533 RepID=UPI00338EE2A7
MHRLVLVDQSFIGYEGHHYEYNMSIAEAAADRGLSVTVAANRRVAVAANRDDVRILPWFRHSWGEASNWERAEGFVEELVRLIEEEGLGPEDHVLVHTVSTVEFIQLLRFFDGLLACEARPLPTVHLLSRRDPQEYGPDGLRSVSEIWGRIGRSAAVSAKCRLHSDTVELARMHRDLTGVDFGVLPIPFRYRLVENRGRPPGGSSGGPVTIFYLGDARLEKGYHLLPDLVGHLWEDWIKPGLVRFVVQSNLNMPGGEPGIIQARNKLRQYPFGVEIIDEPMSAERYYDILAAGDLLVLPYDPKAYAGRSSGVLNEALACGKVTVVSKGSWLANQVTAERGGVFEHPGGLAVAVEQALQRFDALSAAAQAHAPVHRRFHSPENFLDTLLAAAPPVASASGPSVLFVMDGTAMVLRNGASMVAHNQLRHLLRHGYRVHALFLGMTADMVPADTRRWLRELREEVRGFDLDSVWTATYSPSAGRVRFRPEEAVAAHRGRSFVEDVRYRSAFSVPAGFHELVHRERIDAVVLNYVQNLPLVRSLLPEGVPILCESHDIQSFQYAIYNDREVDDRDLQMEVALLEDCRHVIAINPIEADWLSQRLKAPAITYIPQPPAHPAVDLSDMAGAVDLAEVAVSCGLQRDGRDLGWLERLRGAGSLDLLYVSSAHRPNLDALRWFLDTIHRDMLAPHGVTLALAGSVCDAFPNLDIPGVFPIGRVETLAPLYAAARVVLLPMRSGAGSPIKTLESLSHGKPVVATSAAMRGLRFNRAEFPLFDDTAGYAARILELLRSPEARRTAGEAAWRISRDNGNDGLYESRLAAVMRSALGDRTPGLLPVEPPSAPRAPVEWTAGLRALNRLLRAWCAGEPATPEDWTLGRDLFRADPGTGSAVVRRFLEERNAPVLAAHTDLGARLQRVLGNGIAEAEAAAVLGLSDSAIGSCVITGAFENTGGALRLDSGASVTVPIRSVCGPHVRVVPVFADAETPAGAVAMEAVLRDAAGAVTDRAVTDGAKDGGVALAASGGGPATRVWTIAGRVAGDRPVTLRGLELRHVFDVRATGAGQADFTTGWNAVEVVRHIEHGSWGFIWSGPEPESEVRLPFFLDHGTDIRIRLTSVIDPAILDGIRATLDGVEYPVTLSTDGYDRVLGLRANPDARPDMEGRHSLRIILPRTMSPRMINQSVGDDRMLGIAVTAIEVRTFHPLHPPSPRI